MAEILVYLSVCSTWVWEECVFWFCWMTFVDIDCIQLIDGVLSSVMSLLIFCLLDLPISDRGELEPPTMIGDSSISLWNSISFCLIYCDTLLLGAHTLRICPFGKLTPLSLCNTILHPWQNSLLWGLLCLKLISYPCFLLISVSVVYFFPPSIYFFFFWLCCEACGILVPWRGIEPRPQEWKCPVLTAGLSGNALSIHLLKNYGFTSSWLGLCCCTAFAPAVVNRGCPLLWGVGFSLWWSVWLQSTCRASVVAVPGLRGCGSLAGSIVVVHGLS